MKEKISVELFVNEFIEKGIKNTQAKPHAIEDFIQEKLEIKKYLPFNTKRTIAETIVAQNIEEVDGVKKYDSISAYVTFVVSTLVAHTNLEFSDSPVLDYDLLAESGLLPLIIMEFKASYDECDVLLKLALADAMADNNLAVIVGKFLNGILDKLDDAGEIVKSFTDKINLPELLGTNIKEEDVAKILGFVDKLNK